jgi:hippurate hydrolase
MKGTARWFTPEVGRKLELATKRLTTGIAESFGARATISFGDGYPPLVNDHEANKLARRAAAHVAGAAKVVHMDQPTMGAEDFAFMLEAKQGSYLMLGSARGPDDPLLHHPRYDFNDEILPVGASYFVALAEQLLPKQ